MTNVISLFITGLLATSSLASTTMSSVCPRNSTPACPTKYDPCCAFVCAEAQVPFKVCSPENQTVFAQCSKCPSPTHATHKPTKKSTSVTRRTSATTTTSSKKRSSATLTTSTCTPYVVTSSGAPACPTKYNACCAWTCAEAQVPYAVCQATDGSGEFAVCSKCPSPMPR